MKVLITGAAGFIGQHLAPLLASAGYQVALIDRNPDKFPVIRDIDPIDEISTSDRLGVDLADSSHTTQALRSIQPDIVIHLASSGVSDPDLSLDQALEDNLFGTLNLIEACFGLGAETSPGRLIVARTPGELTTMNAYSASKGAAWNFCTMYARTRGYPIVGAMFFQVYGPKQPAKMVVPAAFQAALSDSDFPMTSGEQEKDWIYINDLVAGVLAILDADLEPGTTVQLGTGRAVPLLTVVQKIYDLAGGSGRPRPGQLKNREGEAEVQQADLAATQSLIQWRPLVPLDSGLRRYRDWLLNKGPGTNSTPR